MIVKFSLSGNHNLVICHMPRPDISTYKHCKYEQKWKYERSVNISNIPECLHRLCNMEMKLPPRQMTNTCQNKNKKSLDYWERLDARISLRDANASSICHVLLIRMANSFPDKGYIWYFIAKYDEILAKSIIESDIMYGQEVCRWTIKLLSCKYHINKYVSICNR